MSELSRQNQKLGVEHADLQIRVVEDQETIQKLEKENRQYFEQLESLRFMWNAKNEENEKLKAAASALERLNLELSQKLNEIRKQDGL
jgi:predicted RNase H-like nuclease (RuvC/YqgF family)